MTVEHGLNNMVEWNKDIYSYTYMSYICMYDYYTFIAYKRTAKYEIKPIIHFA